MSKIFDFVKPGVITGDDVQKVFQGREKRLCTAGGKLRRYSFHQRRSGSCSESSLSGYRSVL